MSIRVHLWPIALALTILHRAASAQFIDASWRAEGRLDARVGRVSSVEMGGGVVIPAGIYVRVAALAGGGVEWRDGVSRGTARVEVLGRFLVDPLRQRHWAPYGAGGVGARLTPSVGDVPRVVLVALLGVEGPPVHGIFPAFELGLGGGVRAGFAIRRAPAMGR